MKRLIKLAAASAAALALVFGSTSIAQAVATRALAAGNVLYGLDGAGAGTHGTLHNINPLTGATTVVGSRGGAGTYDFAYQAAYNPVDGQIYWSGVVSDGEHLWKTNPATGAATQVADFTENGTSTVINALAIGSDGRAYGTSTNKLYSVNLSTGALTLITNALPNDQFYAFAFNPRDEKFYAISNRNNLGLHEINVTTGVATQLLAMSSFPDLGLGTGPNARRVYSMTFDQNGSVWLINQNGDVVSNVVTGTSAADFVTGVQIAGTPGASGTNSLVITYPASNGSSGNLANTGTLDGLQAMLAGVSALAIAVGASLTAYSRRRSL